MDKNSTWSPDHTPTSLATHAEKKNTTKMHSLVLYEDYTLLLFGLAGLRLYMKTNMYTTRNTVYTSIPFQPDHPCSHSPGYYHHSDHLSPGPFSPSLSWPSSLYIFTSLFLSLAHPVIFHYTQLCFQANPECKTKLVSQTNNISSHLDVLLYIYCLLLWHFSTLLQ